MNQFLLSNQRIIILITSLIGVGNAVYTIYHRVVLAFDGIQDPTRELPLILFELPFVLPGLLGLFYFLSRISTRRIPILFLIYCLALILIIALRAYSTDALEFGLPMVLIFLPMCVIISVLLIKEIFKNKKN
jgi:hypothetical protein